MKFCEEHGHHYQHCFGAHPVVYWGCIQCGQLIKFDVTDANKPVNVLDNAAGPGVSG